LRAAPFDVEIELHARCVADSIAISATRNHDPGTLLVAPRVLSPSFMWKVRRRGEVAER